MLQSLPIGTQSFRKLRRRNNLYIDKTEAIFRLISTGGQYFLSRPRRFGKSLMLSTIESIYKGEKEFFKGLWIENNWDWSVKNPVVHISFNSLAYQNGNLEAALQICIDDIAKEHNILLEKNKASDKFKELLQKLAKEHGQVALLIDEYDKPLIDYLEKDKIHIAKENQAILKSFYSVIKGADEYIEFMLLTGVSKFSKVSIFSDLNQLNDITTDKQFGTLVGWTIEEIRDNLEEWLLHVHESFPQMTYEAFLVEIKRWYNGYSWDNKNYVYNPFSLLLFLQKQEFMDYWFKSGTPTFLINLLKERDSYDFSNIKIRSYVFDSYDLDNLETVALLFQTGYLTIKSIDQDRNYHLGYPNMEVQEAMYAYLMAAYGNGSAPSSATPIFQLRDAFQSNDVEKVVKIIHSLFKNIPYDLFKKQSELLYHALIHLAFHYLGIFIQSEVETSDGRIDAVISTATHVYILEFKIEETAQIALDQIKKKDYASKYALENKVIVGIGINFSKEQKGVQDSIWEKLN